MCQNEIVAFGMNLAEIMLSIFTVGCIVALAVVMIAYLNGHFNSKRIDLIDIDLYTKEELKNIRKYGR